MNVLWLNSGGKDAAYVIQNFEPEYPEADVTSFHIKTDNLIRTKGQEIMAKNKNLVPVELDYTETRNALAGYNTNATQYWGLEYNFRALQYAIQNGHDTILSGATNLNWRRDKNNESEFESIMDRIQNLLEIPAEKKVQFMRPVKLLIDRDIRDKMYDEVQADS